MTALILLLGRLSGCGGFASAPAPSSTMLVCDASDGSTCTKDLRIAAFESSTARCGNGGGCQFQEVFPRAGFGAVVTTTPIVAPKLAGLPNHKLVEKRDAFLAAGKKDIMTREACPDACQREVSSDLPAAIAVAALEAANIEGPRHLLVISDGLAITRGCFNFENSIPAEPSGTLACLDGAGLRPNLAVFDEITLCGLHHRNLTADQAANRAAFWRSYIRWAGGVEPKLMTRCDSAFMTRTDGM